MWGWLRRRRSAPEIPEALWRATLARYPFLAGREQEEARRLRALAARFLADKEFHGAGGLAITDEIALAIAAQAVLPVLHLGLRWYDDFVGIVVHPDEVLARRSATDDTGVVHDWNEVLAGEAMEHGPVMLNWRDVAQAGDTAETGFNVVIHEFVHKIDMRDGAPDGCPPLASKQARERWLAVLQPQYERFR
ncbi:MAG TPA: M90 family metallopeptidase, partial [Ramlibacter sp.]